MQTSINTGVDPYLLAFTFVLGAASAFLYIRRDNYQIQNNEVDKSNQQKQQINQNNTDNQITNPDSPSKNNSKSANATSFAANHNDIYHVSSSTNNTTVNKQTQDNNNTKQTKRKPIRIYVDGCWDVCHSGHYNAIRQAKALGDYLILGIHSDLEISHHKRWPVMNNEERLACVRACKWIDQVVFDVPYSVSLELLDRDDIKADYVAHGDDIAIASNGKSAYDGVEHKLKIFKRTPGVSTTALIQRLLAAAKWEENRSRHDAITNENDKNESENENSGVFSSWSQFLSSSHRIASFSNSKTPNRSDKVIYIDGVFDLFHAGHIAALKEAKKEGTFLYVGLFDDMIVRKKKGPFYPLMNLQERTLNVLACKYVDEVIIGCPWNISDDMLKVLNISCVISTPNTDICDLGINDKRYDNVKNRGIFKHIIPSESNLTTSNLIKRIVKDQERMAKENEKRIQKEVAYLQDRQYVVEN